MQGVLEQYFLNKIPLLEADVYQASKQKWTELAMKAKARLGKFGKDFPGVCACSQVLHDCGCSVSQTDFSSRRPGV